MNNKYTSLAELISSIDTITKNKKGFGYTYLELVKLFDEVQPKIKEAGFLLAQSVRATEKNMKREFSRPFTFKKNDEVQITEKIESVSFEAPVYELHSELVWIETGEVVVYCDMPLYTDDLDPQAIGSAETYMRRYSVFAMLGIKTEDDDGYSASPKAKYNNKKKDFKDFTTAQEFIDEINKTNSLKVLGAMWYHWKDKPFAKEVKKVSDARKLQLENPDLNVDMPTTQNFDEDYIPY